MSWTELFNGRDLSGWAATGDEGGWDVDDGCIRCRAENGGYLYTLDRFEDFELALEYRTEPRCNSGVFFRWSDLGDPVNTGLEIQILDTWGQEQDRHSSGALYDLVAPARDVARPAGEWNRMLLTCRGPRMRLEHNGLQAWDVDVDAYDTPGRCPDGTPNKYRYAWKEMPRSGHIGLQDHGGVCWFRDLRVRTG